MPCRENSKAKNRSENTYKVYLALKTADLKVGNQLPVLVKETDAITNSKVGHKTLSFKKALP